MRFIARRIVSEAQAEELSREVVRLVETKLGAEYPWPGNFRELDEKRRAAITEAEELKAAILKARVALVPDWPLPELMKEEITVVGGQGSARWGRLASLSRACR